jgi:protein involved in temperature-dependent protein secretion
MAQPDPQTLLREGQFAEARAVLEELVGTDPDPTLRLVLFCARVQTHDFAGAQALLSEIERALPHTGDLVKRLSSCASAHELYVARTHDPSRGSERAAFRPPPAFAFHYARAMHEHASKNHAAAGAALKEAEADRLQTPGVLTTRSGGRVEFTDLIDADELTGATLPLFYEGRVFDVPFFDLKSFSVLPAEDPFDELWPSVSFETTYGARGTVASPALYAGSWLADDALTRLGRTTSFDHELGYAVGRGLRDFWVIGKGGERRLMGLVHFDTVTFG